MKKYPKILALTLSLSFAGLAMAHPGHTANSLWSGVMHPITGFDHLLAMLAVGLWAAQMFKGGQRWLAPLTFVATMLIGFALSLNAVGLQFAASANESFISLSVVLLGLMMVLGERLPKSLGFALIACAGLAHGYAHGSEVASNSIWKFAIGFLSSTAVLHYMGWQLGDKFLRMHAWLSRATGAGIAGIGLLMAVGQL